MPDVRTPSLVDQISEVLRGRLARGEWPIGARLPGQKDLAVELGVSVVVVREALARLRADGLVQPRQGAGVFVVATPDMSRGFRVARIESTDLLRLAAVLEVRTSIEVAAAQLAAMRRDDEDIAACTQAFRALRASLGSGADAVAEDLDFHLAIARASHNEYYPQLLRHLYEVLMRAVQTAREQTRALPRRLEQVQDEHASILQAIVDRRPDEAGRVMQRHLANSAKRLAIDIPGAGA